MKKLTSILFFLIINQTLIASEIIATINQTKITHKEFSKNYKQNYLFLGKEKVTKKKVLNDMINRALGIQKAQSNRLGKSPVVKKKIEDILYHAQISKDLEKEFNKISVSNKDVLSYYSKKPEYRTAHILLRMRAQPSKEEKQEAQKRADKIYKELQKDSDKFAELANKYSQSTNAKSGGDIGFQPAVMLAPEYFEAINGRESGYISKPVRTQFGIHVIKILSKKNYKNINKTFYKKVLYDGKKDQIVKKYFRNLRKGARIKINQKLLNRAIK